MKEPDPIFPRRSYGVDPRFCFGIPLSMIFFGVPHMTLAHA